MVKLPAKVKIFITIYLDLLVLRSLEINPSKYGVSISKLRFCCQVTALFHAVYNKKKDINKEKIGSKESVQLPDNIRKLYKENFDLGKCIGRT